MGILYKYEIRKILHRKVSVLIMIVVTVIMIAMNIGEYLAGGKLFNCRENALTGRIVDEGMLDEMRDSIAPKLATTEDGEIITMGISVKDDTYEPLIDYLYMLSGNYEKAYNMSEKKLYSINKGVIDSALEEQYLSEKELDYWNNKRIQNSERLTYGKIRNGWGDSVTIMYVVSLLALIAVAPTLAGVFSDESALKTDSLIFSSINWKKKLYHAKMLAGVTVGMAETVILTVACIGTEFAVSGLGGYESSVRFFVGPTLMDMKIGDALLWYVGIMLIIGLLFSVMAMCLSQVFQNSIAVIAVMMLMWLLSMLNVPDSLGLFARVWNYLPVTFLGSWTFTDYHLMSFFGKQLTIIESAPLIYIIAIAVFAMVTKLSYRRYQVMGK